MTEVKERRSLIEIKHDLEQLVKYYPDCVGFTGYENGFKPKVIVVGKDMQSIADLVLGQYNMNFDKEV